MLCVIDLTCTQDTCDKQPNLNVKSAKEMLLVTKIGGKPHQYLLVSLLVSLLIFSHERPFFHGVDVWGGDKCHFSLSF